MDVQAAGSAEASYCAWVDSFDAFGVGANTPIATANQLDVCLALQDGEKGGARGDAAPRALVNYGVAVVARVGCRGDRLSATRRSSPAV